MSDMTLTLDDAASLLVGRFVRQWAFLDEECRNAVGNLQFMGRVRFLQARGAPPSYRPEKFHEETKDSPRLRLRYLRLLFRKLFSAELSAQFGVLANEIVALYAIRNDLVHAPTNTMAEGIQATGMEVFNRQTKERRRHIEKTGDLKPWPVVKNYTFSELERHVECLQKARQTLRDIQLAASRENGPIEGPIEVPPRLKPAPKSETD